MNNPLRILQAVDAKLSRPIELILFGRAALALGFDDPPATAVETLDVDGIIPRDLQADFLENREWWTALENTNRELEEAGLYITHLFGEEQIILRRNWREHVVPVTNLGLQFIKLCRPATLDLILTKMMRGADPHDVEDIRFCLQREPAIGIENLKEAFAAAVGPEVPEIWRYFNKAKEIVLAIARTRAPRAG